MLQASAFSTGSAKREVYIRDASQKKAQWASQLQTAKAAAKQQQRAVDRLKGGNPTSWMGCWALRQVAGQTRSWAQVSSADAEGRCG